ncbi:MAG: iron-containing alcohol dehydrogenase [Thermoplasmata archaeon]
MIFNFLPIDFISLGKGSAERISELTNRGNKAYVVTSRSVSNTRFFSSFMNHLPGAKVLRFVTQHSPLEEIEELGKSLSGERRDFIITIGGGSVIDAGKVARSIADPEIVQIAVPTTLSAAEFSHIAGYSKNGEKKGIREKNLVPRYIFLDPDATAETPLDLWRSTGIRSVDHAIESTLGEGFIEFRVNMAHASLTKMTENIDKLGEENRLQCQIASWYSYMNVFDSPMGLSHRIGKIIGPRWGIPHGIASCITLPETLRYYSLSPPPGLSALARIITGVGDDKEAVVSLSKRIEKLIEDLGLRRKFSDYGISSRDVDQIYSKLGRDDSLLREALLKML